MEKGKKFLIKMTPIENNQESNHEKTENRNDITYRCRKLQFIITGKIELLKLYHGMKAFRTYKLYKNRVEIGNVRILVCCEEDCNYRLKIIKKYDVENESYFETNEHHHVVETG